MSGAGGAAGDRLDHYVSTDPFDPHSIEALTPEQERFYLASQWRMMWWRFKRHHLAVVSGAVLALLYLSVLVSEVIAPYDLHSRHSDYIYAPPQPVRLFHDGEFAGPFVYGLHYRLNMENLKREYREDRARRYRLRFLCSGDPYRFWGSWRRPSTWYASRTGARSSCSAPTGSGATCSRAWSTGRGSRSPSGWWGSR